MKKPKQNALKCLPHPDHEQYAYLKRLDYWLNRTCTTRFDLAQYLGITNATVTMWFKRGRVPLDYRARLNKLFESPSDRITRYSYRRTVLRVRDSKAVYRGEPRD